MARADLLIRLVQSGIRGDKATFRKVVEAIIAEERTKQHKVLENGGGGSENADGLYDMDGQELLDELLKSHVSALQSEGSHVETLLDAAVRCEQAGPDAKAEALIEWIYQLQAEEDEPDLKVWIFTEFVPT